MTVICQYPNGSVLLAPLLINSDLFAHTTFLELSDLDPTNEGRCMASLEQKKEGRKYGSLPVGNDHSRSKVLSSKKEGGGGFEE